MVDNDLQQLRRLTPAIVPVRPNSKKYSKILAGGRSSLSEFASRGRFGNVHSFYTVDGALRACRCVNLGKLGRAESKRFEPDPPE